MKRFSGPVLLFAAALAFAGCNKKTTSAETTSPEAAADSGAAPAASAEASAATATNPASGKPAADAGKPEESPLLALLPEDDRVRYTAWFKKYDLGFNAAVLDQDTDGDGYTNREEFLSNTNPRDPNSLPGVMEGVTLKALNEVQVPIVLKDVNEKGTKAHVQNIGDGSLEEIGQGSQPKGLPYRVTSVKHEIKADKHGVLNDVSSVTLENSQTKETVMLIRDLPARSSETHAILAAPDGTEQKVRVDDIISLPGQGAKKFKVVDLRPDQVVVEDLEARKTVTIPKR